MTRSFLWRKPDNPPSWPTAPVPILPDSPTLPALPPLPKPSARPNRRLFERTQRSRKQSQTVVAADQKPIRIAYGHNRIGGEVIWVGRGAYNTWVFHVRWCWGEIWKYLSIELADKPLPPGATVANYIGTTTQPVDPTLAGLIQGFTDTLVVTQQGETRGIAHSVIQIPYQEMPDTLNFTAEIEAMTVFDPRDSQTKYSANPSLHAYDFYTNRLYGGGWQVDAQSFRDAANMNDEIPPGAPGPRFESHMTIDKIADLHEYAGMMAEAAGCYMVNQGGIFKLASGRGEAVLDEFDLRTVSIDRSAETELIKRQDVPNWVRVHYTNTNPRPWKEAILEENTPEAAAGTEYPRTTDLHAYYIHEPSMARRLAQENLDHARMTQFNVTWIHADDGVRLERGDIVRLNTIPGFTNQELARVLRKDMVKAENGYYWKIYARHFTYEEYSDSGVGQNVPPGIDVDDPTNPTKPTDISAVEAPWLDASGHYQTEIHATWTGVEHAHVLHYRVTVTRVAGGEILYEATVAQRGAGIVHEINTGPCEQNVEYQVEARSVSATGHISLPNNLNFTPIGDALDPPAQVTITNIDEVLWRDQQGATNSRLEIYWTGLSDPWVRSYDVQVTDLFGSVHSATVTHIGAVEHRAVVENVEQVQHTVNIWAINVEGDRSTAPGQSTITPVGRTDPPANVTNLDAVEYTEYVELTWDNVLTGNDSAYRIKRGNNTSTWENADLGDITIYLNQGIVSGNEALWRDFDVPEGDARYHVKGVTPEGLESVTAASFDITVINSKGATAKDRPRPAQQMEYPASLHDDHSSRLWLRDYVYGYLPRTEFSNDPNWQSALELGPNISGAFTRVTVGFQFQAYSSGEAVLGLRITTDNRVIYEYVNRYAKPAGSSKHLTFTPIGMVFVDYPNESRIYDVCDDYVPFNNSAKIEIMISYPGGMTINGAVGMSYMLT